MFPCATSRRSAGSNLMASDPAQDTQMRDSLADSDSDLDSPLPQARKDPRDGDSFSDNTSMVRVADACCLAHCTQAHAIERIVHTELKTEVKPPAAAPPPEPKKVTVVRILIAAALTVDRRRRCAYMRYRICFPRRLLGESIRIVMRMCTRSAPDGG